MYTLRLPFLIKPVPVTLSNRLNKYCVSIETPALNWLHQRLDATVRFRANRVLLLDDIDAVVRKEGETDATRIAALVGGFTFTMSDLQHMLYLLNESELDSDGGLLLISLDDFYLLSGWIDHEVDLISLCPGRYQSMAGITKERIFKEMLTLLEQLKNRTRIVDINLAWPLLAGTDKRVNYYVE